MAEGSLRQHCKWLLEFGQISYLGRIFNQMDCIGSNCHCSNRLFVASVPYVNNSVTLFRANAHFVMDLGYERTNGIDYVPTSFACFPDNFRRRPVSRQHYRTSFGYLTDVINKHHPEASESIDYKLVVNDLVVAVDRRIKRTHHPGQRLYRHLYPGTKTSG